MVKEVFVNISGLQMDVNEMENQDEEPIEVLSPGNYYFKDGTHYIFFEEVSEGIQGVTKTQIKIKGTETVEVIKRGATGTHMIFEKAKKNHSFYETPYGQLNLGVFTREIMVDETENNINIKVEYMLDVNYEPLAECKIRINVQPRDSEDFSICEKMTF